MPSFPTMAATPGQGIAISSGERHEVKSDKSGKTAIHRPDALKKTTKG